VTALRTITEATTLAELREQRLLLGISALRVVPSLEGASEGLLEARAQHATGSCTGLGPTAAEAIEAAFAKLRSTLLDSGR
jgi:hypothetical protein